MKRTLLLIMLLFLITGNAEADWKKNLKKAGEATKKTAQGIRKTTKKATKGIKKTTKKAKEEWDKRERPCVRCGKMTRLGKLCAECKKKSIAATGREIGRRGKKVIKAGKKGIKHISKEYQKWSPVVQEKYGEALGNIRDPEQRAKMKEALIKTSKVASQIRNAKNKGVYLGLSKTMNLKLPENLGGKTLGEEIGERLIKMNPELAGMGIDEDPALALTAVVCLQPGYFINDFKPIKRDGRNVSFVESVKMSSSFDASGTIKSLKTIAATERLASGEGDIGDLVDIGNAINSTSK